MADNDNSSEDKPIVERQEEQIPPEGGPEGLPDYGAGSGRYCVCPECGQRTLHQKDVPCFKQQCPECRTPMTLE